MEISQFKDIDDVSYLQPEVPLTTTTVEHLKWFGQELTDLWIDKSNNRENMHLPCKMTQKVNVTFNVTKYFIWPQSIMDYPDHSDQIVAQSNDN